VQKDERLEAIRTLASHSATIDPAVAEAKTKYQVFRLNTTPVEYAGRRYDAVRLKLPPGDSYTLAILFVDVGNIVEYEVMPILAGSLPVKGNTRLIHPAFEKHDHEVESDHPALSLPKPWDHFELHLLGFSPELVKPASEYLIWFRFADAQPADVLMAATLLRGTVDVTPEKLPAIFGLPKAEQD